MIALEGIALVPGSAAGAAIIVRPEASHAPSRDDIGEPHERFAEARRAAESELRRRVEMLADGLAREILRAHLALIADPMVAAAIAPHLDSGLNAPAALERARSTLVARFEAIGDPRLRARAADLSDICDYIARHLHRRGLPSPVVDGRIVCAAALSPAQVLQLSEARPLAFVVEGRAEASHAAILIRALGVPAIVGVDRVTALIRDGDHVLVDASAGKVIVNAAGTTTRMTDMPGPAAAECDREPARTCDGVTIAVTATIADARDARRAMTAGADGIGLFRTEWLFMRSDRLPSEAEQFEVYREVATLAGNRPVTVRTLDLGGDKQPPALRLPFERNPALGLRGVRLALAYPDLLETQMRALARAFDGHPLRVMLPMVTDPADLACVRRIFDRTTSGRYEIGAMIETPAAALMVDELAAVSDFFSLGTNDLTQYVLAADRDSAVAASRYQPIHPAVLRLVRLAAAGAARAGRPLSACGETARDPVIGPLLVGMGVTELSVAPDAIVTTKRRIRRMSIETARVLGDELAALPTVDAVAARLGNVATSETALDVHTARDAG